MVKKNCVAILIRGKVINYPMVKGIWGWIIIAGFLLTGCYETTRQITPFADRDYQKSYKQGTNHHRVVSQGEHKVTMVSLQKAAGSRVEFTIEVENGSAAPIEFGVNHVTAVTADELNLYINTLDNLNKEVAGRERFREFWNSIATVIAVAGAQGTTVHYGNVNTIYGSETYTGVTYDPTTAAIQQRIAKVEGRQRSSHIRNQADKARHQYASKILKARELNPGEKVSGSLWIEIPYERSGMVYFNVYTGSEKHRLAFKVGK